MVQFTVMVVRLFGQRVELCARDASTRLGDADAPTTHRRAASASARTNALSVTTPSAVNVPGKSSTTQGRERAGAGHGFHEPPMHHSTYIICLTDVRFLMKPVEQDAGSAGFPTSAFPFRMNSPMIGCAE